MEIRRVLDELDRVSRGGARVSAHDGYGAVNAADVLRIMSQQVADLSRQLAIMQARAEQAEKQLAARGIEPRAHVPNGAIPTPA